MKFRKSLLIRGLLLSLSLLATAQAPITQQRATPLPWFYKTTSRVLWLVSDIDRVRDTWTQLGLIEIHEYPRVSFTGLDHGKPVTIHARELTGGINNLGVEIIQPAPGQHNAFNDFLAAHGDGIFAVLHEVPTDADATTQAEVQLMSTLGVGVLSQLTTSGDATPTTFTLFDTEPQGKFVLGLIAHQANIPLVGYPDPRQANFVMPSSVPGPVYHPVLPANGQHVTHFGILVRDPKAVSAYWHRLGFPAFNVGAEPQRDDFLYRRRPLHLDFGTAAQPSYDTFTYEWVRTSTTPPNLYNDFYKSHHNQEGIQHLGFGVDSLGVAVAAFQKAGFTPVQSGHWNGPNNQPIPYTGMESPAAGGIHAELVQTN